MNTLDIACIRIGTLSAASKNDLIQIVHEIHDGAFTPEYWEVTKKELLEEIRDQVFTAQSELYREAGKPEDEGKWLYSLKKAYYANLNRTRS